MSTQTSTITRVGEAWETVRAEFNLTPDYIHLATTQFLASHPRPVREAIERHRRALDANPVLYAEENEDRLMQAVREAAARYLGAADPNEVALTDSTTMGLGVLYAGLPLDEGDEILTTDHEHYSHLEALRGASERRGISVRKVRLYDGSAADVEGEALVERVVSAVGPRTRVVGVTWVQSDTGLKFPVGRLGAELARLNRERDPETRVRLSVDGTHGIGVETDTVADLRCEFLIADTHKWLYGPRGTGFIWAPLEEWKRLQRVIPSFTEVMDAYSEGEPIPQPMDGRQFTPGGFHSLEHRWATTEAFAFHERLGRARVARRIRELNRQCKEGLIRMPHVKLHTPLADELSAGIVAFEIRGMDAEEAKERLQEQRIIATVAPYPSALLRLTPGIINTPEEVEAGLAAVRSLSKAC